MRRIAICFALLAAALLGAERTVDPTFMRRNIQQVSPQPSAWTADKVQYRPLFGEGDKDARTARGVARYGGITLDPGGTSKTVSFPREEQIYYVVAGAGQVQYGDETQPVRQGDFMYLAPGSKHGLTNNGSELMKVFVMGFRIPASVQIPAPGKLQKANIDEIKKQVVGNHPPSTLYQLMLGDTKSTRDRIAAGLVVTSLYIMEFAPGGTNAPHHHDREEEIYLLLDGEGEMVAGGGVDGTEGKYTAKAGDAYFFRMNTTVGFYNGSAPGTKPAHILAVRSLYPFGRF